MGLINYADYLLGGTGGQKDVSTKSSADVDHILHALKMVESGGDYGAKENSGSGPGRGAYQFTGTWPAWSKEYFESLGLPPKVLPMTEDNQDAVARFKVKQFADEGNSPRQIASIWNSGKADYFGKKGVNKWGIPYNVAKHVEKFQEYFDQAAKFFASSEAEAAEADYSNMLVGGRESAKKEPSTPKINYADMLLKGESIQAPTESQEESERYGTEPQAASHAPASFETRTKAAFTDNPETMIDIMAASRFPYMDPEHRRERYFIKDGKLFYLDVKPGTNVLEAYSETGEGLVETAKNLASGVVGKGFPAIGGAVGLATGGITGMMAGAAAGEGLRQGVASYALREEKAWPDVVKEVGKETLAAAAGLGAARGVIEPGINALGRAGSGRLGRLAAKDYRTLNPVESQRLIALGEKYGIPITTPEATGSPSLINAFNVASTSPYPVAERIMQWAEEQRIPSIKAAIKRELDAIFPEESIFEAGRMGQKAASDALGVLKQSRKASASPWYKLAEDSGTKVDIVPVLEKIDELQASAPRGWKVDTLLQKVRKGLTREEEVVTDSAMPGRDEMKGIIRDVYANIDQVRKVGISTSSIRSDYGAEGVRAINRAIPGVVRANGQPIDQVAADYGFESGDTLFGALSEYQPRYKMMALSEKQQAVKQIVPVDDIKVLHGAKMEIDSLLKGPDVEGLPLDIKRQVMEIKDVLVDQMEAASPEYAEGMRRYREGSKLVNDFLYGKENINPSNRPLLSTIGKIATKKEGEAVENVPKMLFSSNSSPAIVKQAKRFVEAQDPEAWRALVRAELQDRLETAVKNSQGIGYGYKFKETVFGTPRQQSILREALTDNITGNSDAFDRWSDFMDLLDVTNRIVYRNSRTTPLAITKEMIETEAGGIRGRLMDFAGTKLNWLKWADINRRLATPEYLNRVYDAMMDPTTATRLGRIKQLSPGSKKAIETISLMGSILGENVIDEKYFSETSLHPERAKLATQ